MNATPTPLSELLHLAEWGPRQLVSAINARLSSQGRDRLRLDQTAGYSWANRGFRPRPPIPDLAAAVLSERLGYTVTAAQVWPGRQPLNDSPRSATTDLDHLHRTDDIIRRLQELNTTAATPASPIADASGLDLTAAVLDQLHGAVLVTRNRAGHEYVPPEQVDLIAGHVAALRRLDDRHGGGTLSLRYVTAELRSVIDLVDYANYDRHTGSRLLAIVADLAQLLGWLHFDSSRFGAAERYLLLSVGISRSLGTSDRAANAIGMLAYVSAFAGHGPQAVRLAETATAECARPDPILRARLLGREATAAAADGDLARFRRCADHATALLDHSRSKTTPSFLYYLTPEQLAAETGQGLLTLAERTTTGNAHLLAEATDVLAGAMATMANATDDGCPRYARSRLLHTTFLARSHLLCGDLHEAVITIRSALWLLPLVQSPRGRTYLRNLRPALARRSRSQIVREFLPEFDAALSPP
jgi:hypothetical protein